MVELLFTLQDVIMKKHITGKKAFYLKMCAFFTVLCLIECKNVIGDSKSDVSAASV